MEHCKTGELTRDCLTNTYNDVFTSPVESLPADVHFELDRTVAPLLAGLKGTEPIADDILIDGCRDTEEEATHDYDANSDLKTHQGGCVPSYTQVGCAGGMIRTQRGESLSENTGPSEMK